jgi:hypothetical protein
MRLAEGGNCFGLGARDHIGLSELLEICGLLERLAPMESYNLLKETIKATETDRNLMIKECLNWAKEIDYIN